MTELKRDQIGFGEDKKRRIMGRFGGFRKCRENLVSLWEPVGERAAFSFYDEKGDVFARMPGKHVCWTFRNALLKSWKGRRAGPKGWSLWVWGTRESRPPGNGQDVLGSEQHWVSVLTATTDKPTDRAAHSIPHTVPVCTVHHL